MFRRLFAWISRHERHLSALAMIGGAICDQLLFGPVDVPITQAVFISYITVCVLAMAVLHRIETRADHGVQRPRWRGVLPLAIQFALGGFWSGFIVFYGRSAAFAVSWPFLALLGIMLILNELLRKYHGRLIFTNVLFFFALFSYAIFALPVFTGALGTTTFLESGFLALGGFAAFQLLLFFLGHSRYRRAFRGILVGTVFVYLLINVCYFTSILPPLPLSLKSVGIYHSLSHTDATYTGVAEPQSWEARFDFVPATIHLIPGESLYAYSAVFTPIALTTEITHRWEWFDPNTKQWVTESRIAYPIAGGRDGGYRGYSAKENVVPGLWRVDIETIDGRLIGRINFNAVLSSTTPEEMTETLN